jgi:hypothetical protein
MNCFNIRETQGILKRKFFTDLINSHDHKNLLDKSMIGLRYKSNTNINLDLDMLTFYNFGIHSTINNNNIKFLNTNFNHNSNNIISITNIYIMNFFNNKSYKFSYNFLIDFSSFLILLNTNSFLSFPLISTLIKTFFTNFYFLSYSNLLNNSLLSKNSTENNKNVFYRADSNSFNNNFQQHFLEHSQKQRFNRFNNLLVNYDYKTGHYIGN